MSFHKCFFLLVALVCVTVTVYIWAPRGGKHAAALSDEYDSETFIEKMKLKVVDKSDKLHSPSSSLQSALKYNFTLEDLHRHYAFSTDSPTDILLFIHIQKTGGTTFGKNLVTNLDVRNPCNCQQQRKMRCDCLAADGKKIWLFSRYSTGWICGLHADLTEWTECLRTSVPDEVEKFHRKRRYLMFTVLRKPTERYLSEFFHVSRGATWSDVTLRCNGRSPTKEELPGCYEDSWEGVRLKEFLNCSYNLAENRQTRMLANLSLVGCYDTSKYSLSERKNIMLKSAQDNLKGLSFFGLKEFPNETQYLFEHTFNIKFKRPLGAIVPKTVHETQEYYRTLKLEIQQKIIERNDLDIKLYEFAKQLFFDRYRYVVELEARRSHANGV